MAEVGISSDGRDLPDAFRNRVLAGERGGASTIWIANHLFQRDPIARVAMALADTKTMRAALMAISPFTVHPVQATMAAATLDESYPGRVVLCFGVGAPTDLASINVEARTPIRVMTEALGIARALLNGETVRLSAQTFSVHDRRLFAAQRSLPLVLAASGQQMLALAGRVADGVLISSGTSVKFVEWALQQVRASAAGRTVRTHVVVQASINISERLAHDQLRRSLAILLRGRHHRQNLELAGSRLDGDELNRAVLAEDWKSAEAMITDDIVRRHAASGTPADVKARLAEYRDLGVDEIIVAGARGNDEMASIIALARHGGAK